jgi:hypothetical protein
MTSHANANLVFQPPLDTSFLRRLFSAPRRPNAQNAPEDARARRDFIQNTLARNPGAFDSDLDVQSMMLTFPGRF